MKITYNKQLMMLFIVFMGNSAVFAETPKTYNKVQPQKKTTQKKIDPKKNTPKTKVDPKKVIPVVPKDKKIEIKKEVVIEKVIEPKKEVIENATDNKDVKIEVENKPLKEVNKLDVIKPFALSLGYKEGLSINAPNNITNFSLAGYAPALSFGLDYFFIKQIGIHIEGSAFFAENNFSVLVPASLRYKFINSNAFDSFLGLGGFYNYFDKNNSFGVIAEIGMMMKISSNFSFDLTIDVGHNIIPAQATTLGAKIGVSFLP